MTTVTIYDAEKAGNITQAESIELALLDLPVEFKTHAGIFWTEKTGGGGEDPTIITINSMSRQFIYTQPRLIFTSNRVMVISALSDRDASGTLRTIKKYYIKLEHSCDN